MHMHIDMYMAPHVGITIKPYTQHGLCVQQVEVRASSSGSSALRVSVLDRVISRLNLEVELSTPRHTLVGPVAGPLGAAEPGLAWWTLLPARPGCGCKVRYDADKALRELSRPLSSHVPHISHLLGVSTTIDATP